MQKRGNFPQSGLSLLFSYFHNSTAVFTVGNPRLVNHDCHYSRLSRVFPNRLLAPETSEGFWNSRHFYFDERSKDCHTQTEMPLSTKWKLKFNPFLFSVLLLSPLNIFHLLFPRFPSPCLLFSSFICPFFFLCSSQTTKAFLPRMLELQHGHVVCINSILSQSPIPGAIDYCTSKASSLAFMESLTLGLLDCPGVGCTTVLPFHTNTEMFQGMRVR